MSIKVPFFFFRVFKKKKKIVLSTLINFRLSDGSS